MNARLIGETLRMLRGDRSQAEVAKAVGVNQSAIANYEAGTRIPCDEVKVRLALYFNVTVDFLFFTH